MPERNCGTCKISTLCIGEDLDKVAQKYLMYCSHCGSIIVVADTLTPERECLVYQRRCGTVKDICADMRKTLRVGNYASLYRIVCSDPKCERYEAAKRSHIRDVQVT